MNKHTKMAFIVAPFLAVFGWVISDIWLESQAMKNQLYTLSLESNQCDVVNKKCIVTSGDVKISVYEENGITVLNSTLPLDKATFFLVDKSNGDKPNNSQPFLMGMKESPFYWYQQTGFSEKNKRPESEQIFRMIVTIKDAKYIGEFVSTTAQPNI